MLKALGDDPTWPLPSRRGDPMKRKPDKRHKRQPITWAPFTFVSLGLAAASGHLPLGAFMAYVQAPKKVRRR